MSPVATRLHESSQAEACAHCGAAYTPRKTYQRFCSSKRRASFWNAQKQSLSAADVKAFDERCEALGDALARLRALLVGRS